MRNAKSLIKVLIAGIGGASLGTEIAKALHLAEDYEIYGCDIAPLAYGHYMEIIKKSFLVSRNNYINDILDICCSEGIFIIIPGGEEPMRLLSTQNRKIKKNKILLVSNTKETVDLCSDKAELFAFIKSNNIEIPRTLIVSDKSNLKEIRFPCIIKPSKESGGSSFVYLVHTLSEANEAINYLVKNEITPVIQEYISEDEGEYTIGVLHAKNGFLIGSIAMRRSFNSKLSVMMKSKSGLISTGYSQGLIDDFPKIRLQAERIADLCQSRGPLNIQGRCRDGIFFPFEINPRFSASTFLRALAGFNEVDIFIKNCINNKIHKMPEIRYGYYLRTLSEKYINQKELKK